MVSKQVCSCCGISAVAATMVQCQFCHAWFCQDDPTCLADHLCRGGQKSSPDEPAATPADIEAHAAARLAGPPVIPPPPLPDRTVVAPTLLRSIPPAPPPSVAAPRALPPAGHQRHIKRVAMLLVCDQVPTWCGTCEDASALAGRSRNAAREAVRNGWPCNGYVFRPAPAGTAYNQFARSQAFPPVSPILSNLGGSNMPRGQLDNGIQLRATNGAQTKLFAGKVKAAEALKVPYSSIDYAQRAGKPLQGWTFAWIDASGNVVSKARQARNGSPAKVVPSSKLATRPIASAFGIVDRRKGQPLHFNPPLAGSVELKSSPTIAGILGSLTQLAGSAAGLKLSDITIAIESADTKATVTIKTLELLATESRT